ncbi:MAG: 1-(5-phosphoribosyl)-5-[(5-phosphoribosylamino)methylideneamino]imidazole-4-carboxamide isomerase [Thermaurantiacus tibetensis]|uniref:1-(5-phosphoribosyl)-5-[(5- phosphoribosylamino)methylideneamino]imidazole-4- carboxamide isomerase n=1 Tax=Thermaurantiacus tibetensis TaxID=2759035 RepID=UPI001F3AAE99|nr:1-(5-phosphoribosyl)-5-[(5-phosphoribosylamino)methylideneamino]imidazole-4-carboxamide isomerase [Thermaurantiacus tibetensis]
MEIWPAIDLKAGQVVRLAEGDMARATVYAEDPAEVARAFAAQGAGNLHVVDLDGATAGSARNRESVMAILAATGARVQVGGGIRSMAAIEGWLAAGAARVVLGTAALEDPALVRLAARRFPGAIVVAVDARDGLVATRGWAEVSTVPAVELGRRFADAGVAALLFTDIGRDGLMAGVNVAATAALAAAVPLPVLASGGIASLADLAALRAQPGIAGAVVGRALYEGRFTLAEALDAAA